ncbi:MAG: ArsA family ATPase [Halopseudomonas sp.]
MTTARQLPSSAIEPNMIDRILDDYRVVVCGGTGGVGKTTVSAALGIAAAQRGKRVLVLTVDPARRLANALGLDQIEHQLVEIPTGHSGQLWISMLQPDRIFEHFIDQVDVAAVDKQRLKQNRLFQQLSTTLSGSQEFTSLMWLQQLAASGDYDLIILDTPPSDHAIDFIHAPERIAALFEGTVAKFFAGKVTRLGILNKLLVGSTQLWLKALSKLTGAEFIDAVSDFVTSIDPFSQVISARSRAAERLLKSDQTAFFLVASPDPAKLEQGQAFHDELQHSGYRLQAVVINRAYPCWFQQSVDSGIGSTKLQGHMQRYYQSRIDQVRASPLVSDNAIPVMELPELVGPLAGPDELQQLANYLLAEPAISAGTDE